MFIWHAVYAGIWPLDPRGRVRVYDFSIFWTAARLMLNGDVSSIYDFASLDHARAVMLNNPQVHGLPFVYPPPTLLFLWPLGLIGYDASWIAFSLTGLIFWGFVLWRVSRDPVAAPAMALAFGGATQSLLVGQNGMFSAALMVAGMHVLPERKRLAGVLFGLLVFKVHLGVALVCGLLLWKEWTAVKAAAITVISLSLLTTALLGWHIWVEYVAGDAAFAHIMASDQSRPIWAMMQSIYAAGGMRGGMAALAFHLASAMASLLVLALISRSETRFEVKASALITCTLLLPPYLFLYDATMLTAAALWLLKSARSDAERTVIFLAIAMPGFWMLSQSGSFVPWSAWTLLGIAWWQARFSQPQRQVQASEAHMFFRSSRLDRAPAASDAHLI